MTVKNDPKTQSARARQEKVQVLQVRLQRLEQDADPSPLTLAECSHLRTRIDQIVTRVLYGNGIKIAPPSQTVKDRSYHAGTLWA